MGGRGSAGHRWRGTVSGVRSAGMRLFQGGQDIGCVLGGGGGSLPGGRTARRVIRRMTRVSHDGTPPPSTTPVTVSRARAPRWQPPLRHFPLLLFIYFPLSSPPLPFFLFFSLSVFMCLSDEQLLYDCWLASTHPRATMWSVKRRRQIL